MKLIIMGPPGAGKGTQAALIKNTLNIPHISTGDMFREAIKNETPLGVEAKRYIDNGELVPDSVTIGLVRERLSNKDCQKGFLLDGFPRTIPQAKALDEILKDLNLNLDAVINIAVDDNVLVDRIVGRRVCPKCKAGYHITNLKPKVDGICDVCGEKLVQRKDDTEETVKNRLNVYANQTKPLLEYYDSYGIVKTIDGVGDIDVIFNNIKSSLGVK
ncbi:MAG: adenylate kinase [Bacilli bacterium]|nr:adenylate kinase [Acholeplasmataceae bacterium]MDY2902040.1 adenylate kinase [Bacilli bacterium]